MAIRIPEMTETEEMNYAEMLRLTAEYHLYIPQKKLHEWRPTQRLEGSIVGVKEYLTVIATDGVLGFFLTDDGMVFQGHIQCFDKPVKTLFSAAPAKPVKRRITKLDKMLALLVDRVI